jgi:hypothetical protein
MQNGMAKALKQLKELQKQAEAVKGCFGWAGDRVGERGILGSASRCNRAVN